MTVLTPYADSYYQPNPQAPAPFTSVSSLNDPDFSACSGQGSNCYDAWAMRVVDSSNILIYGAGFYSFFNNYNGCKFIESPLQIGPGGGFSFHLHSSDVLTHFSLPKPAMPKMGQRIVR